MYIKRNNLGAIEAVSRNQQQGFSWLEDDAPELLDYVNSLRSQQQLSLEQSDQSMARVMEDVINLLIERGVIRFTDLPDAAQAKLLNRRQLRDQFQSVYVLDEEDDLKI